MRWKFHLHLSFMRVQGEIQGGPKKFALFFMRDEGVFPSY